MCCSLWISAARHAAGPDSPRDDPYGRRGARVSRKTGAEQYRTARSSRQLRRSSYSRDPPSYPANPSPGDLGRAPAGARYGDWWVLRGLSRFAGLYAHSAPPSRLAALGREPLKEQMRGAFPLSTRTGTVQTATRSSTPYQFTSALAAESGRVFRRQ